MFGALYHFLQLVFGHCPDAAVLGRDVPGAAALGRSLLATLAAGIGVHRILFTVLQLVHFRYITHIRWCGGHRVHQPRFDVHTDVRFHADDGMDAGIDATQELLPECHCWPFFV